MADRLISSDPATGEAFGSVEVADAAAVSRAVDSARAAQPAWDALGQPGRLDVLHRFQRLLLDERRAVADLITRESGKPLVESLMADVLPTLDMVKFLTKSGAGALRAQHMRLSNPLLFDRTSDVERAPLGVVGIIAPWNYPLGIPATQTVAALFAGNAVVLKPSELTPLVGARLVELLTRAGLPDGVVELVQGPGEPTGAALAKAPLDLLIFTGSVPVGRIVARACAERLTPVILELGGKDPMLVLEDANVELAAKGAVWGAFTNAGQTCAAVERVYVHESIAQQFTEQVIAGARRLRLGPGHQAGIDMGPLIREEAVRRCEEHVADAQKRGAAVRTGGHRMGELGPLFYAPTVLTQVNHSMLVMREETFGPLLPIQVVATEEQAVALANDSDYGLSASVWTTDAARGRRVAGALAAGTVTINDCVYSYAASETPWGGVKASGLGHTHGRWGLEALTRLRHTNRARVRRATSPWYYPYDDDLGKLMDEGLEFLYGRKRAGLKVTGALRRRFFGGDR